MFHCSTRATVLAGGALLAVLIAVPAVQGQENEDQWKNLVMQALGAASANDYPRAEQAFLGALREAERFGPQDTRVGTTLNSLGLVYRAEKKFSDAERAYRRALVIMNAAYGDSIDVGNVNFNIVNVMFDQGRHADALPFIRRALGIYEKLLGPTSLKTAAVLCMEGEVYRLSKHFQDAEGPLHRCADIREMDSGLENSALADALYSLAMVYVGQGKFWAAEPRLKLAEKIREMTAGITSPLLAQTMEDHAAVLKALGRDVEAQKLTAISAAIRRGQNKDAR
jgi:tetratricopeptide (TPR) repeat protein